MGLECLYKCWKDDGFIASQQDFRDWVEGRKQLRMEYSYREMRRKTGLLMDGDQPKGEQWNYDSDNRKLAKGHLFMPALRRTTSDATTGEMAKTRFSDNFGTPRPFWYAATRPDAVTALQHFVDQALPNFGDYQDAMLEGEPFLYRTRYPIPL